MPSTYSVSGFVLQDSPGILVAGISGQWLLRRTSPSWRIKNPVKGFQRVVRQERAQEIALAVLDQGRTFPNTIVLATNARDIESRNGKLQLPTAIRFMVVDGQHRLWAQRFANFDATYGCVIHLGLTEKDMAKLFLEINDNQRRVPSSLRWDLVRLVRPDDDPDAIKAAELVYELAQDEKSPLYQRVDLTGEQGEMDIKQSSIAPEIKSLVSARRGVMKGLAFEQYFEALIRFIAAVKSVDPSGWKTSESQLAKARVLRALLRLIPEIATAEGKPPHEVTTAKYAEYLGKIDLHSLDSDNIRALQGSAGIKAIHDTIKSQVGL
jgi:DGQHR domain-containing protein